MSASEVQERLRNVIDDCQKIYRAWVDGGLTELTPEDELWRKFSELAATGKEAAGISGLYFELAADFFRCWGAFARNHRATGLDETVIPSAVWEAWDKLEDIRTHEQYRKAPPLERLEDLLKLPNIGPAQICKIYGWEDSLGRPDIGKVREETAKEPKDRVTPQNPNQARFDREHAEREETVANFRSRAHRKIEAYTKPGRESLKELVEDGVSASQISKIKRISTDEVFKLCAEQGLPTPALDYSPAASVAAVKANKAQAVQEEAQRPADAKRGRGRPKKEAPVPAEPAKAPATRKTTTKEPVPAAEPPAAWEDPANDSAADEDSPPAGAGDEDFEANIDQQIAAYHGAGYGPAELVQVMAEGGHKVDRSRVNRVLQEIKAGKFEMAETTGDEE